MSLNKGWTNTIDAGTTDPSARTYDPTVQTIVTDYNNRLAGTPGYTNVDWKLMRAMVWVESGGPKCAAWTGRVMQIGNPGDPGYAAVRSHEGATVLVVPRTTLERVANADRALLNEPLFNIEVGIAYLFVRMALSEIRNIPDADTTVYEHTVQAGENPSRIASEVGTTVDEIIAQNPGINVNNLRIGQVLKYRKARTGRQITGWLAFTPDVIARRYNVGDPSYADKLRYVMEKLSW